MRGSHCARSRRHVARFGVATGSDGRKNVGGKGRADVALRLLEIPRVTAQKIRSSRVPCQTRLTIPSGARSGSLQRVVRPHCCLVKVRQGLLNLQTEDTFRTLATRDSFGPTGARLMSTHRLAG
jgi:hypothetical protein